MIRELYTSELTTDEKGVHDCTVNSCSPYNVCKRKGEELTRFRVILPEDLHSEIIKHSMCREMHVVDGSKWTCLDVILKETGYDEKVCSCGHQKSCHEIDASGRCEVRICECKEFQVKE